MNTNFYQTKEKLSILTPFSFKKSFWCIEVLKEALALYPKPQIFNTDQGSQ